jgi:hypothetical protein
LTNLIVPAATSSVGALTFATGGSSMGLYFRGNAPNQAGESVAYFSSTTVYYLPGTIGWDSVYFLVTSEEWTPQIQTTDGSFGVFSNQFGFNISGNFSYSVEATTNLARSDWTSLAILSATNGSSYFSDPYWKNFPNRFYRLNFP